MQYVIVRDYTGREIDREYGDFPDAIRKLNERNTFRDGDHLFIVDEANYNWEPEYDRFEAEKLEFHRRVRAAFLARAAAEPARFCVIDAAADPETVRRRIREAVHERLA